MRTEQGIWIAAPWDRVFKLAAEVERWPEFLAHYRWVKLLARAGDRKLVQMAARRDWIPVSWTSIQEIDRTRLWMGFYHVAGFTRGMRVEWSFREGSGGLHVTISHQFCLPWPLVGAAVSHYVVGQFFVSAIAGKTLQCLKQCAEGASSLRD